MATEKFIMTEEQIEAVVNLLNSNGYEARKSKWDEEITIFSYPSKKHVTLQMDEMNGVYLSTTGQWLDSVEKAKVYAKELIEATNMMEEIFRITGYNKEVK